MRGVILVLLALASRVQAGAGAWEPLPERDGVVVERRDTGDPSVRELRLVARSPVPPAAVMATLWKHEDYVRFLPHLKRLDVLRDDGDTKLLYEQIRVPIVKDRDVTVRVTRTSSPDTGTYDVTGTAVPDEGPPESRDYVRVRTSHSHWSLAPTADGGTLVTYTIRIDPGGHLPSWIFDAIQKDVAVKTLRAMLDRARQNHGD